MLELKWEKDEVCAGSETSGFGLINGNIVEIVVIGKAYEILIDNEVIEESIAASNLEAKFEASRLAMQHAAVRCVSRIL
ncbi:hypothetical protein [Pannonibacter sp. P2PFMT1]|uniref:hypothetical protein n=1 Tax=Pannonibacter sp. P2PFMT1 TaxID=2003582 RepID=UPI001647CE61|nr:hypothetical protein [Pannonibacter sp. P2PFMT1]